ncbi:zinc-binding dehydrogenase [Amycolatopsis sp. NPDC047767]|uniref:zinc-binding dehydrogenase n=1 Tax=Amycolatopsis sp. NPDC047767 TaxID=3156765 RepID=UPI0034561861
MQIEIARSGVNPTDVKARSNLRLPIPDGLIQVPHHDGSGVIRAVGAGVKEFTPGQRVWTHLAAYRRLDGTAQQFVTLATDLVAALPDHASHELGAALGVPFLTAHRLLTLRAGGPEELGPGALTGTVVLVAGGAGAVGNASIQLAKWAGATVVTTVSSPEKAELATAAGADHVIDYRRENVVARVRRIAPEGVDIVVEVSPAVNARIDFGVVASSGTLAIYANDGGTDLAITVQDAMWLNLQIGFVILYTLRASERAAAVRAIVRALETQAIGIGPRYGLPVRTFGLDEASAAHSAVENGFIGKVQLAVAEL